MTGVDERPENIPADIPARRRRDWGLRSSCVVSAAQAVYGLLERDVVWLLTAIFTLLFVCVVIGLSYLREVDRR